MFGNLFSLEQLINLQMKRKILKKEDYQINNKETGLRDYSFIILKYFVYKKHLRKLKNKRIYLINLKTFSKVLIHRKIFAKYSFYIKNMLNLKFS